MTKHGRASVLFLSLIGSAAIGNAAQIYDLGTLGGRTSHASGVNSSGQVVGYSDLSPFVYHAFLYQGGTMQDLGTLGGEKSMAFAVNSAGYAVGWSLDSTIGSGRSFEYANGTMSEVAGSNRESATAINDKGEVVGTGGGLLSVGLGYLYSGGGITYIPGDSNPNSINNNTEVVGQLAGRAFYYYAGTAYSIGGLGSISSSATAINDREQIVGWFSQNSIFDHHAFLYQLGSVTALGTLNGDTDSEALAISQDGHIVGWSGDSGGRTTTAFMDYHNVMTDLNTFLPTNSGWHLDSATGITDSGLIVGNGRLNGGDVHAFLLDLSAASPSTPDPAATPEPGTWAMLLAGTAVIGLRRRIR